MEIQRATQFIDDITSDDCSAVTASSVRFLNGRLTM